MPSNIISRTRSLAIRAVLFSIAFVALASPARSPADGKAVILISLDTLRQDHLGCYGYRRNTSPYIDRFAKEDAVLFDSAYAQAPYTLPSHMSMLTGLYPEAHGILLPNIQEDGSGRPKRLARGVKTLAEALKEKGYLTSAFTDGLLVDHKFGFDQGFDEYRDDRKSNKEENGFIRYKKALYRWIEDKADSDFFLFIHTYDTHAPYVPPEPFRSRFCHQPPARTLPQVSMLYCSLLGIHNTFRLEQYGGLQDVVDRYDGCIAYVDDELGKLFSHLKKLGLWEEALIVVTSDHGESFMENRLMMGHGLCAGNEETLIPLIIKLPGSPHAGRRVARLVESVDIMPTILAALGIAISEDVQGQNLLQGLNEGRWEKDYAYGTSPNTGFNHYLVHKGIKFIGAVNDPQAECLRRLVMPTAPPQYDKPETPYKVSERRPYFYDFQADPLGVSELFNRGDRAYDLNTAKHEWKAEQIRDREILVRYKKAAHGLAVRSALLGEKYEGQGDRGYALSREEIRQMEAMGYAGVLNAVSEENESLKEGRGTLALKDDSALVDRTLLSCGDAHLWAFNRAVEAKDKNINHGELVSRLEEARSCYKKFAALHPDKQHWIGWRMKSLDVAVLFLQATKAGKLEGKIK